MNGNGDKKVILHNLHVIDLTVVDLCFLFNQFHEFAFCLWYRAPRAAVFHL